MPGQIRVALIEDDPILGELLQRWIGAERDFAWSGWSPTAEVARMELVPLRPQVALVDINLPGQSAIECLRLLKPLLPDTQFLMFTACEDMNHVLATLAAGATGYLLKRTPRDRLIAALREIHAGGSPMSGSIARVVVNFFQQDAPFAARPPGLSPREHEVLMLLAAGRVSKEIGDQLGISVPTVKTYVRRICEKLHVQSRVQAVARFATLRQPFAAPPREAARSHG